MGQRRWKPCFPSSNRIRAAASRNSLPSRGPSAGSKRDFPLPWDTAPGRTVSSIDGEYSTPTLRSAMWPAWRVGKHKGAQTAIGPSQSPCQSGQSTGHVQEDGADSREGERTRALHTARKTTNNILISECQWRQAGCAQHAAADAALVSSNLTSGDPMFRGRPCASFTTRNATPILPSRPSLQSS